MQLFTYLFPAPFAFTGTPLLCMFFKVMSLSSFRLDFFVYLSASTKIVFPIIDPHGSALLALLTEGTRTPQQIQNVSRSHLAGGIFIYLLIYLFILSMHVNKVSVSRLLWGLRTGGPPTRGRRKPLCTLLRL